MNGIKFSETWKDCSWFSSISSFINLLDLLILIPVEINGLSQKVGYLEIILKKLGTKYFRKYLQPASLSIIALNATDPQ